MSAHLSKDQEVRYTCIIDSILATADLSTVTRKKIRAGLESALGGKDLSDQKEAIKSLIEERFDRLTATAEDVSEPTVKTETGTAETSIAEPPEEKYQANGYGHGEHGDDDDDYDEGPRARKKQRSEMSTEADDAKLAAQLQAQENNLTRARATRGGSVTKKRKVPRKKGGKKVQDDSGVDGSEASTPKRKAGGGFSKPFVLSYPLAQLVGEPQLSRPQVVKKLWEHIKANKLQDPKDGRQIRCDEQMQAVFRQSRVDMFQMNKVIGNHLYPVEEEQ